MVYKTILKVSNVCQLLDKSKFAATGTLNGVTFHNNGDGSYTLNGTSTDYIYFNFYKLDKKLRAGVRPGVILSAGYYGEDCWYDINNDLVFYLIGPGETVNNRIIRPQIFDLTEMYGAGNEPTTVAQFRQDFPEEMYDYSPYCFVKSYKTLLKASDYCQLLDKSKYPATTTSSGVTFTNNGDGTITVNGTAGSTVNANLNVEKNISVIQGHKYYATMSKPIEHADFWLGLYANSGDAPFPKGTILDRNGKIVDCVRSSDVNYSINLYKNTSVSNATVKPQLFDLTQMFGAGNEPTTVAEFREKFPNELYDYKPYSIIPSYKKSLVCKTKNLLNPNTCNIYQSAAFGMNIELIDNNQTVHVYGTSTDTGAFASFNVIKTSDKSIYNKGYKIKFFNLTGKNPPVIRSIFGLREVDTVGQIAITVNITEGVYYDFSFRIMVSEQTATDYVPYGHL